MIPKKLINVSCHVDINMILITSSRFSKEPNEFMEVVFIDPFQEWETEGAEEALRKGACPGCLSLRGHWPTTT